MQDTLLKHVLGNNNDNPNDDAPDYRILKLVDLFPDQRVFGINGEANKLDLFTWEPTQSDVPVEHPNKQICTYVSEPYVPPVVSHPDAEDISDLLRDRETQTTTTNTFAIGAASTTIASSTMTREQAQQQCEVCK